MILDHPIIGSRYFFPRPGPLEETFWVDCGDARLACAYFRRHTNAKTLVYFHGNGEIVADYIPTLAEFFLGLGVQLFLVEYRGYGSSTGRPELVRMLEDNDAIFRALGLPEEELIVFGRSIGSIYAIDFAKRYPNIAGLVIESGIADPLSRVLLRVEPREIQSTKEAMQEEAQCHLNHKEKLEGYTRPLLLLHTTHDGIVDISHAKDNYAWAASAQKTLKEFLRGNHNSILFENQVEYMEVCRQFFASL